MPRNDDWTAVIDLMEQVVKEGAVLSSSVAGVRTMVREVSGLAAADVAAHTRALLVAATRALAARRGPTEAELLFVEDLATTRARQGVPVEAVLRAIHIAERLIWSRAREVAAGSGVSAEMLLDARDLYGDWAESVRARLIAAHRAALAEQTPRTSDRVKDLLRRLIEGGSAAALAAAEAGLPVTRGLWVLIARPGPDVQGLTRALSERAPALVAVLDEVLVAVLAHEPPALPSWAAAPAGVAGPAEPEELSAARTLAGAALDAAEARGVVGVVHIGQVPTLAALVERTDLAAMLVDRHRPAWAGLGPSAEPIARTVRAWLEADREVGPVAESLFVHPNTVRNRVQRFADAIGIDPHTTFGAVDAWWTCSAWLGQQSLSSE